MEVGEEVEVPLGGKVGLVITGEPLPAALKPLEKFRPSSGLTIARWPVGEVTSAGVEPLVVVSRMLLSITDDGSSGESCLSDPSSCWERRALYSSEKATVA